MKILVTGAKGLLGRAVAQEVGGRGHTLRAAAREELDLTDEEALLRTFVRENPDWVVNCAAYTDVDGAESDRAAAFQVNADGAGAVARTCSRVGAGLLHVSTDYVFDGASSRPCRPGDPTRPLNVYGASKRAGEERVLASGVRHIVVRTSWLYGGRGRGFVGMIQRLAREQDTIRIVADQRSRPTRSVSLARAIVDLLERESAGDRRNRSGPRIFHWGGGGSATWFELARETLVIEGLQTRLLAISSAEVERPARRPAYSVLDLRETEALLGRPAPHWREELARYLAETSTSR